MSALSRKFWAVTRWARAAKFWVYVLLALAAIFAGNEARAQGVDYSQCFLSNAANYAWCDSRASAHSSAKAKAISNGIANGIPNAQGCFSYDGYYQTDGNGNVVNRAAWGYRNTSGTCVNPISRRYLASNQCPTPPGGVYNPETYECEEANPCQDAPDLGPSAIVAENSNGKRCAPYESASCEYERATDGMSKSRVMGVMPNRKLFASGWTATGQECSGATAAEPYDPNKPICQAVGTNGAQECIDPNGRHCITFASGLRTCWESNLGEEGARQSADGTQGADTQIGNPPPANQPPPNMQNPQPQGPPSNTEINGTGRNTQIWGGSGTNGPGQPNTGTGGNDPGAPGGDGGDGEGEGEEAGSPSSGLGDLYEGNGKTVGDVVGEFRTRMENAPIASAATGFLTVSVANSCPVWTVPATDYWNEMVLNYHCTGQLAESLALGGWVVLALAAWAAFRWAFL